MNESTKPLNHPASHRAASPVDWTRFAEIVRANRRFVLTTHIRPDCDALGSTLAMGMILEELGKDVSIVAGYDVPANLRWIDPDRKIKRLGRDISDQQVDAVDVVMVLDTSAWAQLSHVEAMLRRTKARKVVVDHHLNGDEIEAEDFRDRDAEATGRLVVEAADALGVSLSPEMASALFAAVSTDTGWFRFPSADSDAYRLAARLIDAGAVPHAIYANLYENETLARLRLIGRAMSQVETDLGGRLIHTWISQEDFKAVDAAPTDSEDVVNMMFSVGGTEGAVILVEQPEGGFKVSFRSRCKMNCADVAGQFGGGGHRAAAGAMVRQPLDAAQAQVLDAVRKAMR